MRKLSYFLVILLFSTSYTLAQDGVLYPIKGDSIVGRLDFAKDSKGMEYIKIKSGKKRKSFRLVDVRMIKTPEGDIIRPVEFGGRYKFGKQVSMGYLSHYKISSDEVPEMFTDDLLTKMNGEFLVIAGKIGFRSRIARYLEDCTSVSRAVKNKKYSRDKLNDIIRDYNACVNKNGLLSEEAIEYKAEQLKIERAEGKSKKLSKSLEDKLQDFSTLLEFSDKIPNKKDVTAMFNDVAGKMRRNEEVPQYLKTALKNALSKDPQLQKLMEEILKKAQ